MTIVHDASPDGRTQPAETVQDDELSGDDDGSAAAVVVAESGRVIEATAGAAALLGREVVDLVGRALEDLADDGWHWVVRNTLLRLAAGWLAPFDLMLRKGGGARALVRIAPRSFGAGGQRAYLLVWQEQAQPLKLAAAPSDACSLHATAVPAPPTLAYDLLRSQELERGRLAAELHDEVAPLATMSKLMVERALTSLARSALRETEALLLQTVARLRDVLDTVCRMSTELRPASLADLGLMPTIAWYCRQIAAECPGLRVTPDLSPCPQVLEPERELDVFRVMQEAMRNVVRHAHAREMRVSLICAARHLQLVVRDDGVGFDAAPFLRGDASFGGLGLRIIRKRVDAAGGTFVLRSSPGAGTVLGASWPLP